MVPPNIIIAIKELKEKYGKSPIKQSYYTLIEKLVIRLDSLSNECAECAGFLNEFYIFIEDLKNDSSYKTGKRGSALVNKSVSHLKTKHKLVPKGHYSNMYSANGIAIGISLGTAFFAVFNDVLFLSLGVAIGVAIGYSLGRSLDANSEKDGLII